MERPFMVVLLSKLFKKKWLNIFFSKYVLIMMYPDSLHLMNKYLTIHSFELRALSSDIEVAPSKLEIYNSCASVAHRCRNKFNKTIII